jgi:predicted PurR-regulated permease PerM
MTKRIGEAALLAITLLAFYLCWLIARPFLPAITWALALAVVAYPLHRRLERHLPPGLAAFVSVVLITIILLAPGFSLVQQIVSEASDRLRALAQDLNLLQVREAAGRYSFTRGLLAWMESNLDIDEQVRKLAGAFAAQLPAALRGSIQFVTQFAIMLVMLFYFLRDHEAVVGYLRRLVPLSTTETAEIFRRLSETIQATLYGSLVVKLVQGLLGGLMFWALGLPAAALAGAAMAVLAMIPVVGTSLVWGPAAVVLFVEGNWIKAVILVAWGGLVVSLIDNVLYPLVIAGGLRLHTLAVFVAVLGGLAAFGIAGAVLGPIILATTTALLDVWHMRAANGQLKAEEGHGPTP